MTCKRLHIVQNTHITYLVMPLILHFIAKRFLWKYTLYCKFLIQVYVLDFHSLEDIFWWDVLVFKIAYFIHLLFWGCCLLCTVLENCPPQSNKISLFSPKSFVILAFTVQSMIYMHDVQWGHFFFQHEL